MKLRSFTGKTMQDVMQQIKKDLGEDAVIVSSRTQEDGQLRITAALEDAEPADFNDENDFDAIDDPSALFSGIKDYGDLPDPYAEDAIDTLAKALLRHSLPANLNDILMTRLEREKGPALQRLEKTFLDVFSFDALPVTAYERPMMLVGQPGAGKTVTIAKLATQAIMHGLKPCVITADTEKAGGVEQLAALMRILNLPLLKVSTPEQLKKAINDNGSADQIFIDCPGINAFDPEQMKQIHAYTKTVPMDLIVVIPGGIDVEESSEIARAFSVIGAKWMIATRLDLSRRLGGLLAAAHQGKLAFAGIGNKADIATGFSSLTAKTLATLFLPQLQEKK